MNDPLLVDNIESQADLNEELPSAQLAKLYQSIVWTGLGKQLLFFLLGNIVSIVVIFDELSTGGSDGHGFQALQILLQITLICIFHDQIELVTLINE